MQSIKIALNLAVSFAFVHEFLFFMRHARNTGVDWKPNKIKQIRNKLKKQLSTMAWYKPNKLGSYGRKAKRKHGWQKQLRTINWYKRYLFVHFD